MRDEHLGLAEEQVAPRVQREVEAPQDARLRLRIEVHERVAARQEVDPRDRRVLGEVVAPEDHRPAQVLAERVALVALLEVALEERGRDRLDLLGRVRGLASLVQCVLVDLGRVDLHAVEVRVDAQRLGEDHRHRVRLLPGRTGRAPDADRIVRADRLEQPRDDLVAVVLPRRGIAEEPRDVDEDRVEQRGELVGLDLEVVEVGGVVADADLLHPLADAALERRALVAGEVEAARPLQVLEEHLERRVGVVGAGRRVRHDPAAIDWSSAVPWIASRTIAARSRASPAWRSNVSAERGWPLCRARAARRRSSAARSSSERTAAQSAPSSASPCALERLSIENTWPTLHWKRARLPSWRSNNTPPQSGHV